jgi:hypothetical protein
VNQAGIGVDFARVGRWSVAGHGRRIAWDSGAGIRFVCRDATQLRKAVVDKEHNLQ